MATQIVCPRCNGSLMPNARACPRCGLLLPQSADNVSHGYNPVLSQAPSVSESQKNGLVTDVQGPARQPNGRAGSGPVILRSSPTGPLQQRGQTGPLPTRSTTGPLAPRGALELLPGETVAYQLGALYLTTKRVILLAPSVVRSAFVRDIDAVGTFTERSSGWLLALVLFLLAVSAGYGYAAIDPQLVATFPFLYVIPPWVAAIPFAMLAIFLIIRFIYWTKRTLFVSVKGRPLITVSISDWGQKKLDGMDEFVNAFFQIKDLMTGDLMPLEQ